MYMILFVLDNPERLMEVLEAWENAGVRGVTILESTGLQRMKRKHLPMRFLADFYTPQEESHLTLLAVVEDEELIHACLAATETLIGDLCSADTGIFTAWPLQLVKGGIFGAGD